LWVKKTHFRRFGDPVATLRAQAAVLYRRGKEYRKYKTSSRYMFKVIQGYRLVLQLKAHI